MTRVVGEVDIFQEQVQETEDIIIQLLKINQFYKKNKHSHFFKILKRLTFKIDFYSLIIKFYKIQQYYGSKTS